MTKCLEIPTYVVIHAVNLGRYFAEKDVSEWKIGACASREWLERLEAENAALRAELMEEARLNGMGAEREAALLGKVERLGAELAEANRVAEFNFAQYQDAGRLLAEVCEYCECERKPSN